MIETLVFLVASEQGVHWSSRRAGATHAFRIQLPEWLSEAEWSYHAHLWGSLWKVMSSTSSEVMQRNAYTLIENGHYKKLQAWVILQEKPHLYREGAHFVAALTRWLQDGQENKAFPWTPKAWKFLERSLLNAGVQLPGGLISETDWEHHGNLVDVSEFNL